MIETVELRNKPELKINLNENDIEIIDASQPKNSGVFSLKNIKSIELNPKRTDWFITIFSWIVDLFTGGAVAKNYKNNANLKLELVNRTLKIWLTDADFKKAERIEKFINNKNHHQ